MACIYKITNLVNGKMYVGQTKGVLIDRWKRHIYMAKSHGKDSKGQVLYKAMARYGIENFTIECLQECTADELNNLERFWIAKLGTFGENGYNMTVGGQEVYLGLKDGLSDIFLISSRYKKVLQYTVQGEFVREYLSIRQAASEIGVNKKNITRCCNGINSMAGGFLWCYKGDEDNIKPLPFGRKLPNRSKTVIAISESGEVITFPNCNEAAKSVGGEWDAIRRRCNGIIKDNFYKGYNWKYL